MGRCVPRGRRLYSRHGAMRSALSGPTPGEGELVSGLVNTTCQIGSAIGLAVMTAIATARGADLIAD